MHEKFLYQDTFEALAMPDEDRAFISKTKSLFDAAHHLIEWNSGLFGYLTDIKDSEQASQVFLEHENNDEQYYDRIVLSAMPHHVIIGLEHRDFTTGNNGYRSSLSLYGGVPRTYFGNVTGTRNDNGTTERQAVEDFKNRFDAVAAAMSLFGYVKRLDTFERGAEATTPTQNESVEAILAKAA